MARMTFSTQALVGALFRDAGVHPSSAEVLAVDNAAGTITLDVRGHGIPDQGEVRAVFQRHQPVTVAFEPLQRDPLKPTAWPSWGPQD